MVRTAGPCVSFGAARLERGNTQSCECEREYACWRLEAARLVRQALRQVGPLEGDATEAGREIVKVTRLVLPRAKSGQVTSQAKPNQVESSQINAMHTHVHACTRMYTHAHACTRMHTHAHVCTPAHVHMHTYTRMHACTHAVHMQYTCTHLPAGGHPQHVPLLLVALECTREAAPHSA